MRGGQIERERQMRILIQYVLVLLASLSSSLYLPLCLAASAKSNARDSKNSQAYGTSRRDGHLINSTN